jgi:hypothetical protein
MKKFIFSNGEERLESQMWSDDWKLSCGLWGCYDKITGLPLPYITTIATKKEINEEKIRLEKNREEYEEICFDNEQINLGNERLANATTIEEFFNAYN